MGKSESGGRDFVIRPKMLHVYIADEIETTGTTRIITHMLLHVYM